MTETKKTVKILLIEENEIVRFYFRDAFWLHSQKNDYDVRFATSIAQARELLGKPEADYNIIFLDLALHGESSSRRTSDPQAGLALVSEIRKMPKWKDTNLIIFSTPANFRFWKKAKQLGASYFLKKDDYLPHHLVDWVENILKGSLGNGPDNRTKKR